MNEDIRLLTRLRNAAIRRTVASFDRQGPLEYATQSLSLAQDVHNLIESISRDPGTPPND